MKTELTPELQAQVDADLAPIRTQIDAVDAQLLTLLNERAKLAQQVGEVKQKHDQPVYRPERESVVLEKIVAGLKQGKLAANGENGPVCVELPRMGELEISFKEKAKSGKSKKKLSIELTWKDGDAPLGLDG